jgi:lysozyme
MLKMRVPHIISLILLTQHSLAAAPPTCTITSGQSGICISTSSCSSSGGVSEPGHCSGASNIQCCTYGSCNVATLSGLCQPNSTCTAGGTAWPLGYCPGDATIQCCTYGSCAVGTAKVPGQCGLSTPCADDGGTSTSGLCPGPDGVRCCSYGTCAANGKSGFCQTKSSCSGTSSGLSCPGGDDIMCCTPGTPTVDGSSCGALTVNQATLELIKGFEGWFPDICESDSDFV